MPSHAGTFSLPRVTIRNKTLIIRTAQTSPRDHFPPPKKASLTRFTLHVQRGRCPSRSSPRFCLRAWSLLSAQRICPVSLLRSLHSPPNVHLSICSQPAFQRCRGRLLPWGFTEKAMSRNMATSPGTTAQHSLLLDVTTDTISRNNPHEQTSGDASAADQGNPSWPPGEGEAGSGKLPSVLTGNCTFVLETLIRYLLTTNPPPPRLTDYGLFLFFFFFSKSI